MPCAMYAKTRNASKNALRVSAVDMRWRISVVWQERWKEHYKALREAKKKKAEECNMHGSCCMHAECAMTFGRIFRRENAQRLKKLKLKRTWKHSRFANCTKFFDCRFCRTWWNWRRLSERSDVRRKAPKALKAGMKRQKGREPIAVQCDHWYRSERSVPMSEVPCKKVSHALLPRQESSGSAFLESLRKHLQRLMPDSCIAMQNRHGSWMVRKDQKRLPLFLVVEVKEILTVYILCYVQITNLWWLMPGCSADSADDFSANVFCCFKILRPFFAPFVFSGGGQGGPKNALQFL